MSTVRGRVVTSALAGLVLASSLLLAGCSAPASTGGGTDGNGQSGSGATDSGTSTNPGSDTEIGSGVPATFPKDVPLISGDVPVGIDLGTGWTVLVKAADFQSAFKDASAKLEAAGFTSQVNSSSDDAAFADYQNDKYEVQITGSNTSDYGPAVSYTVVIKG